MAHTSDVYDVIPLEGPQTIRLVELHPAIDFNSPIECTISPASLSNCRHQYRALSYVWGVDKSSSKAIFNGRPITISANLDKALRRLRTNDLRCCNLMCSCQQAWYAGQTNHEYTYPPTRLWIDAVSINQENVSERNQQVKLMKDIFARAAEVILWVGEESSDTLTAFRFLHALAELFDAERDQASAFISHVVKKEHFKHAWIALGKFLNRRWWTRVWVLQEVVLAHKATLICGRFCAGWNDISKAFVTFRLCQDYIDEVMEATTSDDWSNYLLGFATGHSRFALRCIWKLFINNKPNGGDFSAQGETLQSLLGCAKNYETTDARDKVYGILGIAEALGCRIDVPVRYEESVCNLYMRVAVILYERTKTLHFLSMLERRVHYRQSRNFGLPSWAPDLTVRTNMHSICGEGRNRPIWLKEKMERGQISFSLTRDSTADCSFDLANKRMTAAGFIFDTVETTASRYFDLDKEIGTNMAANATRFCRRIEWKKPDAFEDFECEVFWQSRMPTPRMYNSSSSPRSTPKCERDGDNVSAETSSPVLSIIAFRTKHNNLFGHTDSALLVGDSICALFGADVPYVLRRQGDHWEIVGAW